jgi:hypothetical protein
MHDDLPSHVTFSFACKKHPLLTPLFREQWAVFVDGYSNVRIVGYTISMSTNVDRHFPISASTISKQSIQTFLETVSNFDSSL